MTERTFLTSLLALEDDAVPEPTIAAAVRALMTLTRSRYARAELHVIGAERPMVLVEPHPRTTETALPAPATPEIRRARRETVTCTVFLELHSRRRGTPLTFRQSELFDLLLHAMLRLAHRVPSERGRAVTLHEATRALHEQLVYDALRRSRGNVSHAARELRVTRTFIYKCMRAAATRSAS